MGANRGGARREKIVRGGILQCGVNAGQRLCGYCPHPRAPGALALSLDRERDLEKQAEGKRDILLFL